MESEDTPPLNTKVLRTSASLSGPLPMQISRPVKRLLIVVGVTAAVVIAALFSIDPMVERAVRSVLARAELSGYNVNFDRLHTNVVERRLLLTGLTVSPSEELLANDSVMRFSISADTVELHGVELRKLVLLKILHVGRISVNRPIVKHSYASRERSTEEEAEREAEKQNAATEQIDLSFVRLDTLLVTHGSGTSTDRGGGRADLSVQHLDLFATGLKVTQNESGKILFSQGRTQLALDGIQLGMDPFYTLAIGSVRLQLPADSLHVTDIRLIPEVEPGQYHEQVDRQIELYSLNIDTAIFLGFDLERNLQVGAISAKHVLVAGMEFSIHRDKSIPMGPFKYQPLPSHILLDLPIPLSIDTIVGRNAKVSYSERTERGAAYGTIVFTEINAMITGLDNRYHLEPPTLHLLGTARLAGYGQAKLDMRLPMDPKKATVQLHAELRNVPFEVVNRMTDKLVKVKATAGRIHRVDMHMNGDDKSASGTVEAQYEDLHLELNSSVSSSKALTLLANTVVRKTNMPEDRRYRKGEFTVDRNRDKSVFNFLWLGMREGMMDVMLPPLLMKERKKQRAK